ncbi:DUF1801 domain-containing protein [Cytophaga aurantiaca]|uniref:DUF1801 domain-containing protein n=1 Tax=Cytophaga aurantiaca TaxID=29530 RepID=UPI0003692061|nr:DUF1801 domain-containing protein [Cytophaga aurantiaca]
MKELDNFYLQQEEPVQSCLLALRNVILAQNNNITTTLKYGMPFFCYKGKMFAYLWIHKKYKQPYIGMVEGKHLLYEELIQEKRSRMKIMLFDAEKNLPIKKLEKILQDAINLYISGKIKIK